MLNKSLVINNCEERVLNSLYILQAAFRQLLTNRSGNLIEDICLETCIYITWLLFINQRTVSVSRDYYWTISAEDSICITWLLLTNQRTVSVSRDYYWTIRGLYKYPYQVTTITWLLLRSSNIVYKLRLKF